ncbi:Fungal Zn2-Cys6 binuclear cluster domain-containing protein isoform 2 [Cladophialophora immunda]|nr:Fungal Zn2-Cys6 binuclear cluster domain-containing protein isoform 2 [Cladophialophora immunda]
MSHCGYFSRARSKGDKLGYYRASVACDHCRKRKARCRPAVGDPLRRCANCVRLGYPCVVVKVEVMEALDILGEDGTPENILRVQRLIGHVKTGTPSESCQQIDGPHTAWPLTSQPPVYIDPAATPSPWPCQVSAVPEPQQPFPPLAYPLQGSTTSYTAPVPHTYPVSERSWQRMPAILPPETSLSMPEAPASEIFYNIETPPVHLEHPNCIHLSQGVLSTDMSNWQSMPPPMEHTHLYPAMYTTWEATTRQQYSGLR